MLSPHVMDKNIASAVLAVPLLLVSGNLVGSGGCNYTKPELVFAKACRDDACQEAVRKYLPACKRRMSSQFTKTIAYEGGVKTAPYLSLDVMEKLTDCVASSGFGTFDRSALDFSRFREVQKDVRGDKRKAIAGSCTGNNCTGLHMLPIVGQTTMLHGPA